MSHTSLIFILVLTHSLGPLKQENQPIFYPFPTESQLARRWGEGGKQEGGYQKILLSPISQIINQFQAEDMQCVPGQFTLEGASLRETHHLCILS